MSKYIIIQTWNGEGYSYSNKAEVMTFENFICAADYIINKLKEESYVYKDFHASPQEGCISYETENDDSGTYQYRLLQEGDYGVVIMCNINEARVERKEAFESELAAAMENADEDEIETDGENVFIPCGEYDYSFIKL